MQALTPILINLLFPRSASTQAGESEPSAFSDGYLDGQDDYVTSATHHGRRVRQARRHHSTGALYGRQLASTAEADSHHGTMPRRSKRMSLDPYAIFDALQPPQYHRYQEQQPQPSSLERETSISSLPPLASSFSTRTLSSHRPAAPAGLNITGVPAASSSASSNLHRQHRHRSAHSHREEGEDHTVASAAVSDLYYQPGDEHEHLVESEWVVATSPTSISSPRPSTCSMTSSFSSSSSSYSSLCEPLTPTSATYSRYHSNDQFRKPASTLQYHSQQLQHESHPDSSAPYALSNKDTAAGQPLFVSLASHQWTALDDE
ncbi:hypothetical protein DFQ27_006582 [Actinomortierella ambigua]|uniref:Uncharacterized protein n=1 Tax=Actinomortierella ambigua TaxID=1343610 RepID=A0A9P6PYL5_9FUNG|nr:hypothetical protein DFQ27_006582 [Actinomortierella ambigua]